MRPEGRAPLWDARAAARQIVAFVGAQSLEDYQHSAMLRSAVERQFQIIGEALNRLSRADPDTASSVPDLPRIVAFRNVLVHGYAAIDDELVWQVATTRVPDLIEVTDQLLAAEGIAVGEAAPAGALKPHWPCSIAICLVMRVAFSP